MVYEQLNMIVQTTEIKRVLKRIELAVKFVFINRKNASFPLNKLFNAICSALGQQPMKSHKNAHSRILKKIKIL